MPDKIEHTIINVLSPADKIADGVEGIVNDAINRVPDILPGAPRRILFKSEHNSLLEAMVADAFDLIPGASDVTGFFRMRDATQRGETNTVTRLDFANFIPFLPANTRRYVKKELGKGI